MYVKTQWVDNTTPINSTNMNKIEQGIYDNSLVADAVNNVVKPNDETYKDVEITEGQITDVLGVNDVLIKGNTLQDGEPTPDSPVDVNVVSGSNIVYTSNKNLFNPSNIIANANIDANGNIFNASDNNLYYISVISGETYTMTRGQLRQWVYAFSETIPNKGQQISTRVVKISTVETFTVPDGYNYIVLRQLDAGGERIDNLMILKGTYTTAPGYVPHQGKELPLNLGAIELCKAGDYQDYFYRDNGKWYLHKETEKIILGDYNWTLSNNTSIGNINTNRWVISKSCEKANNANNSIICNILPRSTAINTWDNDTLAIAQSVSQIIIRMPSAYTTAADVKTALQNLNAYSIALRATPTDTEITDTTLISQLEAIYNAPLYEQTNITQENNDLPMVLDITACKDNINGIKAWIRK